MRKYLYGLLLLLLWLWVADLKAQEVIKIYGEVKDENGKPVEGATIKAKHQYAPQLSDAKGHFSIQIIDADTITVTHMLYRPVTRFIDKNFASLLRITLEPQVHSLQEVTVSTGYQDIPKERATGSFYKVDQNLLNQRVGADIISRIDGLTSGLQIDRRDPKQQTIQIRGLTTLDVATAQPLIILDNFPYAGDISNINPNDIESVTVLKDAAASSIWGAKAGNGVIVINTKRAKAGQPLQVSFNSNISLRPRPDLFSANQISVSSLIDLEKDLFGRGYYNSLFTDPTYPAIPEVAALLQRAKNGELTSAEADRQIDQLRSQDARRDMQNYLYRNATVQQYYLNLTGAGNNIRYLISAGYDRDNASLRGNSNDRLTLRSNNLIDLTKALQLSTDILLTRSTAINNSPGGYGSYVYGSRAISPYARLVNADGSAAAVDLQYNKAFTDTAGNGRLLDWKYRPLQELATNDNRSATTDVLFNVGLNYKLSNALKAEVKYQYQRSWSDTRNFQGLDSYATRDLINLFTQLNSGGAIYPVPKKGILYGSDLERTQQALRGQLTYGHLWNGTHRLSAIAGMEVREAKSNTSTHNTYGFDPNTLSSIAVDHANLYPTYDGILGDAYIPDATKFNAYLNRYVSYFANAAYTLKDRYTLSLSARRDESNLFGVRTNQRGVPLWSAGVLWKINREKFYSVNWLPELALRLTYGVSGNISPSESALTRIQNQQASLNPIRLPFISVTAPPNPHLRWEQVSTLNIGLDLGLFDGRLSGSVEYFTKRSDDLINSVLLDPTVGFLSSNQNSASIFGKGFDVVLNSVNLNGALTWRSTLLFSTINYRTTRNLDPVTETGLVSDGKYIFPILNENPYAIISYRWAGLDPQTGDPQGYVNGVVSKDYAAIAKTPLNEQVRSGSALPTVFGTLRNNFDWQRFSLAFNLTYRLGYYFRKPTTYYSSLISSGTGYTDYEQRWQRPGDEAHTNTPSFVYPANALRDGFYHSAAINVQKADNVKLQEIYLSYTLPGKILPGVRSLQFYLFADQLNVLLWKANKAGLDPDFLYNLRSPATYSAGIKLNL